MRNHFFSAAFSSLCWGEEEIGSNRSNLNVSPVIANQCEGTRLSIYRYDNWKKLSAKQIDGCAKNRTKWKLFWKEITFHSTENNEQLTANWKCDGHLGFDTKNLEFKTIHLLHECGTNVSFCIFPLSFFSVSFSFRLHYPIYFGRAVGRLDFELIINLKPVYATR